MAIESVLCFKTHLFGPSYSSTSFSLCGILLQTLPLSTAGKILHGFTSVPPVKRLSVCWVCIDPCLRNGNLNLLICLLQYKGAHVKPGFAEHFYSNPGRYKGRENMLVSGKDVTVTVILAGSTSVEVYL